MRPCASPGRFSLTRVNSRRRLKTPKKGKEHRKRWPKVVTRDFVLHIADAIPINRGVNGLGIFVV